MLDERVIGEDNSQLATRNTIKDSGLFMSIFHKVDALRLLHYV